MIVGRQIRAARALLDMSQDELAEAAGLTPQAIRKIESGDVQPREGTIADITRVFDERGLEFTENTGVRLKPTGIEIFEGPDRFEDFMHTMYDYLERFGGDVCIYIQDESLLQRTRKNIDEHRARMKALVQSGRVSGRILAAKGVEKSSWAEIRRMPFIPDMPHVSFLTFGDNLALISFDHNDPPYVVLHKSGPFAAVYKSTFDTSWEKAKE